ncbi:MAG TPA: segregation/condensation protein A [Cerasibacillus sp.]|uniref:segregation/condensation protein A n=1 Tax=Cerasibacillus sp. TaxID=2498711 RepID=UPI002F3E2CCB
MSQAYKVKLSTFEGPLDLLLHLVNQYEIDIYDIPMAELADQYLEYIHTMQTLELNIASEYLVMAATLIALKSQMLLPKQEIDPELDTYEEDPREELLIRLIEYRKYKEAAKVLSEKEKDQNQTFTRTPKNFGKEEKKPIIIEGEASVYDMLDALKHMFERKQWSRPLETKVEKQDIPIEQRMEEVLYLVRHANEGILFDNLFPYPSRSHIVITFMALLQLMKQNEVVCRQEDNFTHLYIYPFS